MKNKIIVTISFLFAVAVASAQKSNIGFYIGPNYSGFETQMPSLTADKQTGFQVGGYYRGKGFFYGQGGLEYSIMQSEFTYTDSLGSTQTTAVNLRRLQLPLYGGISLLDPIKGAFNIRGYAGPVIRYNASSSGFSDDLNAPEFARFGIDGTIGAGLDILIFSLDAGYTFGLTDLFSNDTGGKGNYTFINVGLKF